MDIAILLSEPLERLEEMLHLLGANPDPGVTHVDTHLFRLHHHAVADTAVDLVVLDGVGAQIEQHLLETRPVREQQEIVRYRHQRQGHVALLRQGFEQVPALLQERGYRHGYRRHPQATALDGRETQDVIDQLQQMPSRIQDLADLFPVRLRQGELLVALQQLGETQDGIQWSPQFVADAGDELTLRPVGPLCADARPDQLRLHLLALGDVVEDTLDHPLPAALDDGTGEIHRHRLVILAQQHPSAERIAPLLQHLLMQVQQPMAQTLGHQLLHVQVQQLFPGIARYLLCPPIDRHHPPIHVHQQDGIVGLLEQSAMTILRGLEGCLHPFERGDIGMYEDMAFLPPYAIDRCHAQLDPELFPLPASQSQRTRPAPAGCELPQQRSLEPFPIFIENQCTVTPAQQLIRSVAGESEHPLIDLQQDPPRIGNADGSVTGNRIEQPLGVDHRGGRLRSLSFCPMGA